MIGEILEALSASRARPDNAPNRPGLYAIFGDRQAWDELGLGEPPDGRPLYVGKAERSLLGRDVKQHFGTGATGSSTLRRTLAALLKGRFGFAGVPRNVNNPSHFSMHSLSKEHDEQLTEWMHKNLLLGTWAPDESVDLDSWETAVLEHWMPPLNLSKLKTKWTSQVKSARKVLAQEAEDWRFSKPVSAAPVDGDMERLLELGFENVGVWGLNEGRLRCELQRLYDRKNVLYAFTTGSRILYIGKSVRTLAERMKGYEKPGPSQRTNLRNERLIREILLSGGKVEIFAWVDYGRFAYCGFTINLAAGLEDSLIKELQPCWNGLREP